MSRFPIPSHPRLSALTCQCLKAVGTGSGGAIQEWATLPNRYLKDQSKRRGPFSLSVFSLFKGSTQLRTHAPKSRSCSADLDNANTRQFPVVNDSHFSQRPQAKYLEAIIVLLAVRRIYAADVHYVGRHPNKQTLDPHPRQNTYIAALMPQFSTRY